MAETGNNELVLYNEAKLQRQPVVCWIHILIKIESLAHRIRKNADELVFFLYPKIFFLPKEGVKHCAYIYVPSHKQKKRIIYIWHYLDSNILEWWSCQSDLIRRLKITLVSLFFSLLRKAETFHSNPKFFETIVHTLCTWCKRVKYVFTLRSYFTSMTNMTRERLEGWRNSQRINKSKKKYDTIKVSGTS